MRVDTALGAHVAQGHRRSLFVYHMDGEQLGFAVGYNAQLVAAVGVEVDLANRNLDAGNRRLYTIYSFTVRIGFVKLPRQIGIQFAVAFVILEQYNAANAVYPVTLCLGAVCVVEHQFYGAGNTVEIAGILGFRQNCVRRVEADRVGSLCCVNGGVRRGNADITGAILVGLMIVPNINRTVCEQIVILRFTSYGRCCGIRAAKMDRLGLASALVGNGQRARVENGRLPLNNAAIGRDICAGRVDFCTVNGQCAVIQIIALFKMHHNKLAECTQIYGVHINQLGLLSHNKILLCSRTVARRTTRRRTAGGRTAARRTAAGSCAANRLGLTCGNRFIAGLDAGNAVCCGNLGAAGGNGYVIGVRLYGSNLACTGNLCAFCVDVDGTDRRAAVYGNGRTLCDCDVVNRAGNRNVGIGDNALAGLGVLEGYTAFAAAQHNAAGDSNTCQVDSADAVCNDEIAVDGLAGQGNAVFTHNNVAVHRGRQRIVCIGVGAGHLTDDLGKFRTGDAGFRVQLTICTVDIAVFDQCSYTALCPCRDRSTIGVIVQNGRIAAFKCKCTREDNKSLFTGDRRFGIQFAVCTLKCAHGNGQFEIVVIPCRSVCIAVNRQISCFASGKGTVDDSSHLGTNQQARAVNLAV